MLGTYRLIGCIGVGGMGEVWKAEDTQLRRMVAIKVLPSTYAPDAEAIQRLRREARTAAQLYHENIATIHEIDEIDGRLFIVMELAEGETLSEVIRRGPLPEADVCRIGRELAEALDAAHRLGIIHRDIKPDNVIVNGARVKVLDFGLARRFGADATVLTQQGMVIGTFLYMSPEQAVADPLDSRTDLFSLGVVLYEMATGRLPFGGGGSPSEALTKMLVQEPAPLTGVSPGLQAIVMRCLRKPRDERYATAGELAQALDAELNRPHTVVTEPQPAVTRRRRWPFFAIVTLVAMVAAVSAFVMTRKPAPKPVAPAPASTPATATATVTAQPAPEPPPTNTTESDVETATDAATDAVDGSEEDAEPSGDDLYHEGLELVGQESWRSAREKLTEAIEADPTHAQAHLTLAYLLLRDNRTRAARRQFEAALEQRTKLNPTERLVANLGVAVIDEEDERAEELMDQLAELDGFDAEFELFRRLLDERAEKPRGRAIRP